MDSKHKIIDALNDILQFLYDSKSCFDKHIKNVDKHDLKILFKTFSSSRQQMINEIQHEMILLGEKDVTPKGTFLGKVHMVFENIKAFLTKGSSLSITKEVRRGEGVLIEYYKNALALDLPVSLRTILLKQLNEIEDDIKSSDLHSIS